jgi:hypothetical protein
MRSGSGIEGQGGGRSRESVVHGVFKRNVRRGMSCGWVKNKDGVV